MASASLRVIVGLGVLALTGWLVFALVHPSEPPAVRTQWTSSQDCRPCHEQQYVEWKQSWHAKSFIDPDVVEQSKNFSNTDCIDCHAPQEIFLTGVGKRVLPRASRRAEGVDCIACHLLPDGDVAGTLTNPRAACRPVATIDLQRVDYCGVCHNQHKTVDQWRETPYAEQGQGCVECHMPFREGDPNKGRSHLMMGGHDLALIQSAVALRAARDGDVVRVEVENHSVGHSFPTDERSRASDVWWRPAGEAAWRHLHRIRDPYRYETDLPRTLLVHGEVRELIIDDPPPGPIEVMLVYKLTPYYRLPESGEPVHIEQVTDPLTDSQEVQRVRVE